MRHAAARPRPRASPGSAAAASSCACRGCARRVPSTASTNRRVSVATPGEPLEEVQRDPLRGQQRRARGPRPCPITVPGKKRSPSRASGAPRARRDPALEDRARDVEARPRSAPASPAGRRARARCRGRSPRWWRRPRRGPRRARPATTRRTRSQVEAHAPPSDPRSVGAIFPARAVSSSSFCRASATTSGLARSTNCGLSSRLRERLALGLRPSPARGPGGRAPRRRRTGRPSGCASPRRPPAAGSSAAAVRRLPGRIEALEPRQRRASTPPARCNARIASGGATTVTSMRRCGSTS